MLLLEVLLPSWTPLHSFFSLSELITENSILKCVPMYDLSLQSFHRPLKHAFSFLFQFSNFSLFHPLQVKNMLYHDNWIWKCIQLLTTLTIYAWPKENITWDLRIRDFIHVVTYIIDLYAILPSLFLVWIWLLLFYKLSVIVKQRETSG